MSDLAFATQTSLYYSISSQNITSHCLCLALLNVTLPLQNSTVICLRHASPYFAIADLHLVSHRHRFTEPDRNVHCLCSSLLNDALQLLFTTVPSHGLTRPSFAIAELRTTGQHIESPWPRIATHSLGRTQLHSTPPRLGSPLLFYTSP